MTTVSDERDGMVLADPGRDRVSVADLPVQTGLGLLHNGGDARVTVFNQPPDLVHVARLEPGLFDVLGVLVRDDPIELFAVAQRVLHQMFVLADPDVDAFLFHELGRQRVAAEVRALEKRPETCVSRRFGLVVESQDEFSSPGFYAWTEKVVLVILPKWSINKYIGAQVVEKGTSEENNRGFGGGGCTSCILLTINRDNDVGNMSLAILQCHRWDRVVVFHHLITIR